MSSDRDGLRASDEARHAPTTARQTSLPKTVLGLHIASIIIAVVYIIIAGTTQLHKYGLTFIGFFCLLGIIPHAFALLLSTAELLARRLHPTHEGLHPGVHIAFSLIAWLGGVAFVILDAMFWAYFKTWMNDHDTNTESGCPEYDSLSGECWGVEWLMPHFMVELLLCLALAVVHFALFIRAIKELRVRKAGQKVWQQERV